MWQALHKCAVPTKRVLPLENKLIYIRTHQHSAAFHFALEDLLLQAKGDYLLLWQTKPTIMIGKYQNIYQEINQPKASADGVQFIRRRTGGGAIFTNEQTLQYSLITSNHDIDFKTYLAPVIKALRQLGVAADYNSRNDLAIAGKKISGSAQCIVKDRLLHHGSLLYQMDIPKMSTYLQPPAYKLKSKGIQSVRQRVTNIADYLDEPLSLTEFKQYLANQFVATEVELSPQDEAVVLRQAEQYADVQLHQPDFSFSQSGEFKGGHVEVQFDVHHQKIENLHFSGDFFATAEVAQLEQKLNGLTVTECLKQLKQEESPFYGISMAEIQSLFPQ